MSSPRASLVAFVAVVAVLHTGPYRAAAAEPDGSGTRIALSLAGGGAKGIAHIGVLRWLDERRIPVDLVTGTSMGALIGGFYAAGYAPDEIERLLAEADWNELFRGDLPFREKSFRRKQDRDSYPAKLQLGLRDGIAAASGLESGHLVGLLLSRMTLAWSDDVSFDTLPIPFRCVATDLTKEKPVVFEHGPLADALRASLAIPGVFAPVRKEDGTLLVDGYVTDNVPTDIAHSLGASTIIAVGLDKTAPPPAPRSFVGLAARAADIQSRLLSRRGLDLADVVIEPDLSGLDALSYRSVSELVARGYHAAEAAREQLLPLAESESAWAARLEARRARRRTAVSRPAFVEVDGVPARDASALAARLSAHHAGRTLDLHRLSDDITAIVGDGWMESASFGEMVRDGERGLIVTLHPKPNAPPSLDLALHLHNESRDVVFSLGGRATFVGVVGGASELRLDAELGSAYGAHAELYRPLRGGPLFLAPFALYRNETENIYADGTLLANVATSEAAAGLVFGVSAGPSLELRSGYSVADFRSNVRVGLPDAPLKGGREEQAFVSAEYTTLDDPFFPTRGVRVTPEAHLYVTAPGTSSWFGLAGLRATAAIPFGPSALAVQVLGQTTFGSKPPLLYLPTLGGPGALGAFGKHEFRDRHSACGGLTFRHAVGRSSDFVGGPRYLVMGVELGSSFDDISSSQLRADVHGGFAFETVLGPASAEAFLGSGGAVRIQVTIGAALP